MDLNHIIDSNNNGGDDSGFGKEIEYSIEMTSAILEKRIYMLDYRMHLRILKIVMLDSNSYSKCLSSWTS